MLATGVRASEAGARGELGLRICESPLKMMMCLAYFRGPSAPQRTFPIPTAFQKYLVRGVIRCVVAATAPNYFAFAKRY